jgi:DhnA family fructose-bisphosphate aldolase class Ia
MSNTRSDNLSHFLQSDGRTVILPIDHGTVIPVAGLEDPAALVESMNAHVDGYVVNLGVARCCQEAGAFGDKGICLRTDTYKPTYPGNPDEGSSRIYGADEAEAVGAHAMMNMCYLHHQAEAENYRECGELISESLEAEIPVILESLPFSIGRPDDYTVENIGFAVRLAAELGADIVKTAFPTNGSVDDFKAIVDACFVPVVVLGGAAMGDDRALLQMVKNSIDAGAIGIAVGRNVWQHANPPEIAAALRAIVHDDASVDSALQLINS